MYRLYTDKGILKNIYGLGLGYKYINNEKYSDNEKYNIADKYKEFSFSIDYIDAIQSEFSLKSQYEIVQSEKIMKNIIEDLKYSVKNTGWFEKIEDQPKKEEIFKTALIGDEE